MLSSETRLMYSTLTQKAELLAFKCFREEYEAYLDYLLGDDRLMMKHKIEKIGKMYSMKSILRQIVEGKLDDPNMMEGIASRQEIMKDKLLISLIENPKKLWKHLNIKVRNSWISRVILNQRLKNYIKSNSELESLEGAQFQEKIIELFQKAPFSGKYWSVLKGFLLAEAQSSRNLSSVMRSFGTMQKNAFQTYFYSYFEEEDKELNSKKQGKSNSKGRVKMRSLDEF